MERNPLRELRVWMAEHLTARIETARRLLERTMQSMDEYRSRFRSSGIEK
jgi:hypothetical protein